MILTIVHIKRHDWCSGLCHCVRPEKPQRYRGWTCLLIQVEIRGRQPNLLGFQEELVSGSGSNKKASCFEETEGSRVAKI